MHAIEGSAALDLAIGRQLILPPDIQYYKIATGDYVLCLRDSSNDPRKEQLDARWIQHASRNVDRGFRGEIKIMAYVTRDLQFNSGDRIAQLLLFPYIEGKAIPVERAGMFESTGKWMFWQAVINDKSPKFKMQINDIEVERLVDTDVEVTVNFQGS